MAHWQPAPPQPQVQCHRQHPPHSHHCHYSHLKAGDRPPNEQSDCLRLQTGRLGSSHDNPQHLSEQQLAPSLHAGLQPHFQRQQPDCLCLQVFLLGVPQRHLQSELRNNSSLGMHSPALQFSPRNRRSVSEAGGSPLEVPAPQPTHNN